VCVCVCVSGL